MKGKVVIITGGTGGLGCSVVDAFLTKDATVYATFRKLEDFEAIAKELPFTSELRGRPVDVSNESSVAEFVLGVMSEVGRIDALVNLVGAWAGGKPLEESSSSLFDTMINVNLRTAYLMTKAVLPHMKAAGSGRMVCVSSRAALENGPNTVEYNISKLGVVSLVQTVAKELHDTDVTINAIAPSIIDTTETRKARPDADHSKWVSPDDIAKVILFLCSGSSAITSGAVIPVYGKA